MRVRVVPSPATLFAVAAAAACLLMALLAGVSVATAMRVALAGIVLLGAAAATDYLVTRRAWLQSTPEMSRVMPAALAVGSPREIQLTFVGGTRDDEPGESWHLEIYDHSDPSLLTQGLPAKLRVEPGKRVTYPYRVTPTRRGEVSFAPADIRVRSRLGLCQLLEQLGAAESRRVYPDFAQVARYAWLAGDRRLAEIGIKTYRSRGAGTDFQQLAEYRVGDPVRWIDWKATLRFGKPIVREFQDARDQCVMLLVDCGRRMRADDAQARLGNTHFDQVLNAVMLLSYVALKQGDEVGAMTFGTPTGAAKSFAPRKGVKALNALMGELYAVQPTPTHSDYIDAARNLLHRHSKRSLVIIITNFRDEDSAELGSALKLLRTRHLVLLASLREGIVRELASQPLTSTDAAVEVASAHLFEQSRRDAFNRLAAHDALMVDAEPERLGMELVNRYQAAKGAGLI